MMHTLLVRLDFSLIVYMTKQESDCKTGGDRPAHEAGLEKPAPIGDLDDLFRVFDKSPQGDGCLFSENAFGVSKAYLEGKWHIEVAVDVDERIHGYSHDFVAVFHIARGVPRKLKEAGHPVSAGADLWRHGHMCIYGPCWDDFSVFVSEVEGMQTPKKSVSSLVWLEPVEKGSRSSVSFGRFFSDLTANPDSILRNWQPGMFDVAATFDDEGRDHVIKCGSSVVNNIASNHVDVFGKFLKLFRSKDHLPKLLVTNDAIRLGGVVGPDSGFKISQVAFRPSYFGKGVGLWFDYRDGHVSRTDPGFVLNV